MTFHQNIGEFIGTALSTFFYSLENFSILKENDQWGLLLIGILVGTLTFLIFFFLTKKIYEWKKGQEAGFGGVILAGVTSLFVLFLIGGIASQIMQGKIFDLGSPQSTLQIPEQFIGNITSEIDIGSNIPTLDIRGNNG